jgi:hypothetical protein
LRAAGEALAESAMKLTREKPIGVESIDVSLFSCTETQRPWSNA